MSIGYRARPSRRSEMYEMTQEQVGELRPLPTKVVHMSRERYLRIVDRELQEYPQLVDQLRPVAEVMPRFRMGRWVDPERGCGCLVGEYLIAAAYLAESEGLARRATVANTMGSSCFGVDRLIESLPNPGYLKAFGLRIDGALRCELEGVTSDLSNLNDWEALEDQVEEILIDD